MYFVVIGHVFCFFQLLQLPQLFIVEYLSALALLWVINGIIKTAFATTCICVYQFIGS